MARMAYPEKIPEKYHQKQLVYWFNLQYPQFENLLVHVPNGQNVGQKKGAELKKMGLVKGFPDLVLFIPRLQPGLIIEMKTKGGRLHGDQPKVITQLKSQGYRVDVCYSFYQARQVIQDYLIW